MTQVSPGIYRLCRLIRIGGVVFVAGVIGIYLFVAFWPELHGHSHSFMLRMHLAGVSTQTLGQMGGGERVLVSGLSVPYLMALVWAFFQLDRVIAAFERGEFFEQKTVAHLRRFAGFLFLAKVLSLMALHARVAVVKHWIATDKPHFVAINLSIDDLSVLLMCALFFLIARLMEEGRRLAEENRGFV
jgi:hypothetical protein